MQPFGKPLVMYSSAAQGDDAYYKNTIHKTDTPRLLLQSVWYTLARLSCYSHTVHPIWWWRGTLSELCAVLWNKASALITVNAMRTEHMVRDSGAGSSVILQFLV
jgi:hypothetical protein